MPKNYINKNFWRSKTVLITGINGFIGGNLAKYLLSLGAKVLGISNSEAKNRYLVYENISNKIQLSKLDLKCFKDVLNYVSKNKIDICIHLAAQVDVNIAKKDPFETFESNIRGTYNLLEALRKKGMVKSIIIASSDKAYGEYPLSKLPYKEDYDLKPLYPYDVSKACGDMIAKSFSSNLFKLPIIITRFANIYGPGQLNFTALIPDCILSINKYRKFIPRGDGSNKRDFLYVKDVCYLYTCLSYNLYKNKNYTGEVFNAGTTHGYTVDQIIRELCKQTSNVKLYDEIKKKYKNKKLSGEIKHQFMNYKKLNKYFGWKPTYSIEDGLNETIAWYKKFLKKHSYKEFLK